MPHPYEGSPGGYEPRRPRYGRIFLILLGALLMGFLGVYIADVVVRSGNSVPNVSLEGVDVGGLSEEEIRSEVQKLSTEYANRNLPLLTPAGTVAATAGQLGFALDVEANVAAALAAGQTGASPIAWASSFFGENNLRAIVTWDEVVAQQFSEGVQPVLIREAAPARLELRDGAFVVEPGVTGLMVTPADIRAAVRQTAAERVLPEVIVVEPSSFAPPVTAFDLQATADDVNARTARGLTVYVEDTIRDFLPAEVRSWLTVTPGNPPAIDIDNAFVTEVIETRLSNVAVAGHGGRFDVVDGVPVALDARPGRRCCAPNAGETALTALQSGNHEIHLHLTDVPGSEGDLIAETGIRELVGEFTTYFTPGQTRVTNIRRIGELVQGAIIAPGERWSVNDYVGRRTEAKGFVPGGVIYLGKFQKDVGGGVSQFATTLFNAAFFAGLDFGEYQAHSIYLSRYPYGREATISYPHPDLQLINNTPYSVLLWPTSTEDSITVRIYSTLHMTVTQSDQWEEPEDLCVEVFTERTRAFADGTSTTDIVKALYQPAEGLNCQGEPFVPPPDCAPGTGAVDTDNDGWVESCRALCPVPEPAGEGAGTESTTGGEAAADAENCIPVCSAVPEVEDSSDAEEPPPCIPLCGPEDTDASPGSCARPGDIPGGPADPEASPAGDEPGDESGDSTVIEPEQGPVDAEAETEAQPIDDA
ncbi:MAG: VanW family protein [Acidimicrobiia bacterium]|nr:VanW family protein [Acidimicrobiia bacterium]